MVPDGSTLSSALLAANERLLALRAQAQAKRSSQSLSVSTTAVIDDPKPATELVAYNKEETPSPDCQTAQPVLPDIQALPKHLGWGSEPLSRLLRQPQGAVAEPAIEPTAPFMPDERDECDDGQERGSIQSKAIAKPATTPKTFATKLYPDIGLAMLREETTTSGRLWLLLRGLDKEGRGCFRVATIKQQLTKKSSPTYLCTWRQMRNLLRDGEGVYWTITQNGPDGRAWLWLRSAAKVAHELGVERLTGRPVALSLEALVNGIGRFRAELYTAFHSGRVKLDPKGQPQPAPIARETLTQLSGVGETTQRRYETAVNLDIEPN